MDTVAGLPLHPLIVHLVVVAVPATAAVGIVVSLWQRARTYLGWFPPVLGLVTLLSVFVADSSGTALYETLGRPEFVTRHADLGASLVLAVGPLFGLLTVQWLLDRSAVYGRIPLSDVVLTWVRRIVGAAVIAAAVVSGWLVVLIGDSGARAVWG